MFDSLTNFFKEWLIKAGISEETAVIITDYSLFILLLFFSYLSYFIAKNIITKGIHSVVAKTKTTWDDFMLKRKVFNKIAFLVPLFLINFFTDYILNDYELVFDIINKLVQILIVLTTISLLVGLINSIYDIYNTFNISKAKPIKGYIQVIKIVIYILAGAAIITILIGEKNGFKWLASFGAFSAVLMLIFKDPILGFVGGIQLTSNNMVQIGDWITMSKYGADGNVTDITLTTVKVQNFDKTITTIPTYTLVTDYFQNWRGMEESGGRRIKRSINIDMSSVKFCDEAMLKKFETFHFIKDYISDKNKKLQDYNQKYGFDGSNLVNGRRQTNLGIFRAYLKEYLKRKPEIDTSMTFLVRQLQPGENGIPVEIYVFSKVQDWALYEDIQSDIFDHILAVIPEFGLKVYQNPTGADFKKLAN